MAMGTGLVGLTGSTPRCSDAVAPPHPLRLLPTRSPKPVGNVHRRNHESANGCFRVEDDLMAGGAKVSETEDDLLRVGVHPKLLPGD